MEIQEQLVDVFRQVFDDETLVLTDEMTADDIGGWDSVAHINLMFSIEQAFGIQFNGNELAEMKNIGELKQLLASKEMR
jgi:acyl carrier protein